jgi:beta-phosphoglucomutase-like phosphatase (HAD superfamily)
MTAPALVIFDGDGVLVDASQPHPASPCIWAALVGVAAGALAYGWRCRRRHAAPP